LNQNDLALVLDCCPFQSYKENCIKLPKTLYSYEELIGFDWHMIDISVCTSSVIL